MNLSDRQVTVLTKSTAKYPEEFVYTNLEHVAQRVKDGEKSIKERTARCRKLASTDIEAYRDYKAYNMPAVISSGVFKETHQASGWDGQHTGIIVLDIDHIDNIAIVKENISQHPSVCMAFISPSGDGLKPFIEVSPLPKTADEHNACFLQVSDHFTKRLDGIASVEMDRKCKNVNRLCYVSYDPDVHINFDACIPFEWDPSLTTEKPKRQHLPRQFQPSDNDRLEDALSHISADDYDVWIEVGMGLKSSGVDIMVWDKWSQSSVKYNSTEVYKKWDSFKGASISIGSIFHRAKENGWQPTYELIPIQNLPPVYSLERQLDISEKMVSENPPKEGISVEKLTQDPNTEKCYVVLTDGNQTQRVRVSDYISYVFEFGLMSLWKRSDGKITDKTDRRNFALINNACIEYVGTNCRWSGYKTEAIAAAKMLGV